MSLKIRLFTLALCLFAVCGAQAQPKNKKADKLSPTAIEQLRMAEDTLALLAYAVVNDSIEIERFAACRALIQVLTRALKTDNSFQYRFDRLKSISILAPPDSSFRIFTWQMFVNDSTYRHYGAIQMNSADLKLFPLIDRRHDMDDRPVYEQMSPERWYGALYYNLIQFDAKEGRKYLLFGYDAFAFFEKRKIIEVLSFDDTGKPVFGAPVFDKPNTKVPEMRLIFEYAADAPIKVNWDEQYQMILFDHLIAWPSPYGRGVMFVTDGSYDGLRLEKGRWKFVEKVFNDSMKEAPRPEPVLDRRSKDILGKDKKRPKG